MRRKCRKKNRALQRRRLHQEDKELRSSETSTQRHEHVPSLTLTLKKGQDVLPAHWALDISDELTAGVVEEFDANLCYTTARSSPTQDLTSDRQYFIPSPDTNNQGPS